MAGSSLPISPERVLADIDGDGIRDIVARRKGLRLSQLEQYAGHAGHVPAGHFRVTNAHYGAREGRYPEGRAGCVSGVSLPAGASSYKVDLRRLTVQGQSMGGMYTNMVSAVEPRIEGAVPTGAGGYWTYFALRTNVLPNSYNLLRLLIGTREEVTFMHPALHLIQTAWEAIDPITSTPRLAREPLPEHLVRSIYEPVGKGDSYFTTDIYDAMALAYGHPQAGSDVWRSMNPVSISWVSARRSNTP
jgi:hypothetical protein